MASKGNSSGQLLLILIGVLLAVVLAIPKGIWILLGVVAVIWLIVAIVNNHRTASSATTSTVAAPPQIAASAILPLAQSSTPQPSGTNEQKLTGNEERTTSELRELAKALVRESLRIKVTVTPGSAEAPVTVGTFGSSSSYGIPRSTPQRKPNAKWVNAGENITVQGVSFNSGMVYLGSCLPAGYDDNDPCLIDPSLSVAGQGANAADLGYWPSYARISPAARRKYLDWLAGGRSDHSIDIGYVFLFFYGLERRVLIDAPKDSDARSELGMITKEIDRLLSIYGWKSDSFQRYAFGLLDVLRSASVSDKLYDKPIPELPDTYELPLYLKLALGQASRDKASVPADLALAWAQRQPGIYFRTAAQRCATEFDHLFRIRYREKYGAGMVLPQNRTKLKCLYQPASSGFRGQAELTLPSTDLPDVTAVTGPIDALAELVKRTTEELDPYSRLLGKAPETKDTAAARLLLPLPLWPKGAGQKFDELCEKVRVSLVTLKLDDLLKSLDLALAPERKTLLQIARHLDSKGVAIEPDIESGARTPKLDDHIVLFVKSAMPDSDTERMPYRTAQLTLQLAAMVAMADGEFSEPEQRFIEQQIASWEGLTEADRVRLHAHMRLMVIEPVTIGSLKKRITELSKESRETIAGYMASLVSLDGMISPDEVRILEKAYKALGLESTSVFSDLHATSQAKPAASRKPATAGFQLDQERVRALQHESQEVSQLLAGIFTEEVNMPKSADDVRAQEQPASTGVLGLDHQHAALVHLLLSRPIWNRNDLADAAADLELMLDGALERINEASFDQYDQPLFEGDDPLEVDQTMIDRIRHEPAHSPA